MKKEEKEENVTKGGKNTFLLLIHLVPPEPNVLGRREFHGENRTSPVLIPGIFALVPGGPRRRFESLPSPPGDIPSSPGRSRQDVPVEGGLEPSTVPA